VVHLQALPLSLRILAKREMFQIPLPGPAMRTIGMIEVDREFPDHGHIDRATARSLAAGHSLLAYPERTTSADGTIGALKDGAFIIAVASQVPVLPVAIDGTCRIWPPGRSAIHRGQVRIVAGRPLQTSGLTHHDIPSLREHALTSSAQPTVTWSRRCQPRKCHDKRTRNRRQRLRAGRDPAGSPGRGGAGQALPCRARAGRRSGRRGGAAER
jgi:1-acyl-sn-glycerol-3-phosphate acyltransferase